jgi:drug/metabolite transporter (DMT)-like permease
MVALLVHAILGVITIAIVIKMNPAIFKRVPDGPQLSTLEIVYWVVGIASLPVCLYFNIRFVYEYAENPFWGQGDWSQFIAMGFANPASSSQCADYTIGNVILLPLFTIIDGRRRGIRRPWLYLVSSFFTSFAFAWAFYLATVERQRRLQPVPTPVDSPA